MDNHIQVSNYLGKFILRLSGELDIDLPDINGEYEISLPKNDGSFKEILHIIQSNILHLSLYLKPKIYLEKGSLSQFPASDQELLR